MPHLSQSEELSQLRTILAARSIRFGDFTLASGEKSDVYVDAKLTTCYSQAMPLVGRAFLRKLKGQKLT